MSGIMRGISPASVALSTATVVALVCAPRAGAMMATHLDHVSRRSTYAAADQLTRVVDGTQYAVTMDGIQQAVNDLPPEGGTVYVSQGIVQVTQPVLLRTGTTIRGQGGGTVFRRVDAFPNVSAFTTGERGESNLGFIGLVFDNASLPTTASDILLGAGSRNIEVAHCEWVHLKNRAAALVTVQATGRLPQNRGIAIRDNRIVGGTTTSLFNCFQVFDASDVTITGNSIDGWGAIKFETSSAFVSAPAKRITISHNIFHNVDQTNIFVRTNGHSSIEQVDASHNTGVQASMTVLKGMINIGEAVTPGGSTSHVTCTGNVGRGFQKYYLNFGGGYGKGVVHDLCVTSNSFDGRLEDSTDLRRTSESALISLQTVDQCTVIGNRGRYTGRSGIRASTTFGIFAQDTLEFCAQNNVSLPGPEREAGIYLTFPASDNVIADNIIRNPHNARVSGTATSGITLDRGGHIRRTLIYRNLIIDDRGKSAVMKWGIKVGVAGDGREPLETVVLRNVVRGATKGGSVNYSNERNKEAANPPEGTEIAQRDTLRLAIPLDFSLGSRVSRDLVVPLPGSRPGDRVTLFPPDSLANAHAVFYGWVSTPDTVVVRGARTELEDTSLAGRFRIEVHP